MYRNIVFDMGNVLTKYSVSDYIRKYITDKGIFSEELFQIIKNEVCASVEWIRMDRGTLTDKEAVASICMRVPEKYFEIIEYFIRDFRMKPELNLPMEHLVQALKEAGYGLYLMSNTSHRFRKFCRNIAAIAYMDGIWISCEHGLLKPEKEAYLDFFAQFGLKPEECLIIDDSASNIEAAQNLGMQGIVYHQDMNELVRKLEGVVDLHNIQIMI